LLSGVRGHPAPEESLMDPHMFRLLQETHDLTTEDKQQKNRDKGEAEDDKLSTIVEDANLQRGRGWVKR